jgi:hypothetical protein
MITLLFELKGIDHERRRNCFSGSDPWRDGHFCGHAGLLFEGLKPAQIFAAGAFLAVCLCKAIDPEA